MKNSIVLLLCIFETSVHVLFNVDITYEHMTKGAHASWCCYTSRNLRSRRGVGDKPMSCKPGVAGSIPGFSQSVG